MITIAPSDRDGESSGVIANDDGGDAKAEFDTTAERSAVAEAPDDRDDVAEPTGNGGLFGTRPVVEDEPAPPPPSVDSRFTDYGIRTFVETDRDPLSTFALDVDTGSYTIARRYLDEGQLPPRESVRVEEYVNAFDYDYSAPRHGLDVVVDGAPSPFHDDAWLVRVGVQAEEIDDRDRANVALTFVIDTSGSMDTADPLGLVKESLS